MSRVGLFGGTFNPPHLMHKRLALLAAQEAALDRVIIMPANVPPHKQTLDLLCAEARLDLCQKTFFEDIFSVSDMELRREGASYTVDTVRALQAENPADKLFLIIGSDMLLSFHQWYRYEEILTACTLVVLSRETEISRQMLKDYAENTLGLREGEGFLLLTAEPAELSSTQIRTMLKNQEDVSRYLEESTLQTIKEEGYYQ